MEPHTTRSVLGGAAGPAPSISVSWASGAKIKRCTEEGGPDRPHSWVMELVPPPLSQRLLFSEPTSGGVQSPILWPRTQVQRRALAPPPGACPGTEAAQGLAPRAPRSAPSHNHSIMQKQRPSSCKRRPSTGQRPSGRCSSWRSRCSCWPDGWMGLASRSAGPAQSWTRRRPVLTAWSATRR